MLHLHEFSGWHTKQTPLIISGDFNDKTCCILAMLVFIHKAHLSSEQRKSQQSRFLPGTRFRRFMWPDLGVTDSTANCRMVPTGLVLLALVFLRIPLQWQNKLGQWFAKLSSKLVSTPNAAFQHHKKMSIQVVNQIKRCNKSTREAKIPSEWTTMGFLRCAVKQIGTGCIVQHSRRSLLSN